MRIIHSALLSLTLAQFAMADFDPAHWQFRRRIDTGGTPTMVRIHLDHPIYRSSKVRLHDIRIVRDNVETAYILEELRGGTGEREIEAEISNREALPRLGVQLMLDLK